MKRILCLGMACLLTGMGGAAAAQTTYTQDTQAVQTQDAQTQDARLAAVTKTVKAQLGIGAQYTEFYGQLVENELESYWDLQWSAPGDQINVTATADGVIQWYAHNTDADHTYESGFSPKLPKATREQAEQAAQAFAGKVLRSGETVSFARRASTVRPLNTESFYLSGTLYYHGLPTPVSVNMTVRASDLAVRTYNRAADDRIGEIPSGNPAVGQDAAAARLREIQTFDLVYTTAQSANGQTHAVLRYIPETEQYMVDAQTGALTNLSALREALRAGNAAAYNEAAMDGAMAGGGGTSSLTDSEQQGVALLQDVLDKETLDGRLRAMTELGLSGAALERASYHVDRESGAVNCELRYSKGEGEARRYKYAQVNAKTGALQTLYSYGAQVKTENSEAARKQTEAFLKKYEAARFAQTAEREKQSEDGIYVYARQENGYPFPENGFNVAVNPDDGTIERFTCTWTDDVTFDPADGLVSEAQARNAYFDAHTVTLGYVAVPVKLNQQQHPRYIAAGYSYFYAWKLGYEAALARSCSGVDAKTGELVWAETQDSQGLTYGDITADKYPQAMALAAYNIGFSGGSFQPAKQLTQEDLVALMLSANGHAYDPAREGAREQLYEEAYRTGLLTRAECAPERVLTRAEMVRMVVHGTGYGKAAELPGIYRTSFADEAQIPQGYLGYIAIAQGMGLVRGDERGRFQPGEPATREQAVILLFNFMNR